MSVVCYSPFGYEGSVVTVEVDLRKGIPAVDIVDLADGAVKECRERLKAAIRNSGFVFPQERVLISLSPADLKKEGADFDLAIALAVLRESEEMSRSQDEKVMVIGELDLDGRIRPVRGLYAALQAAVKDGIKYAITYGTDEPVPDGILVHRCGNLREAFDALDKIGADDTEEAYQELVESQRSEKSEDVEFPNYGRSESLDNSKDFDGKKRIDGLKLAMTVAAAGGHNLMVFGPPGCGKSLALMKFYQLLPKMTEEEAESVRRIYSLAGMPRHGLERPFRCPHQSASLEGMCGGGVWCRPGEITLAHNGVLFLDEAAEFKSGVLQILRVPLNEHRITLSRAGRSTIYPANFQLLMATNPCPCGNYGNKDKVCFCSLRSVEAYWKKFSAPLLDRIAIRYDMSNPLEVKPMTLAEMREKIKTAVLRQREREKRNCDIVKDYNEALELLGVKERSKFNEIVRKRDLSPRGAADVYKVALTLADLDGRDLMEKDLDMASKLRGVLPLESGL